MLNNVQFRRSVESALEREPGVDATGIGVATHDGVVTLTGFVKSFAERVRAVDVVKGVAGVQGIANELDVRLDGVNQRSDTVNQRGDTEIAEAAIQAVRRDGTIPEDRFRVRVSHGWVTLEGEVEREYQRNNCAHMIRSLTGVSGVVNNILVRPDAMPADVRHRIEDALRRSAEVEARGISVEARDGEVVLAGRVRSWTDREAADAAACAAPGVHKVHDRLVVDPSI